jgi:WXG100 protein secretion system (Wss), protein YukD
MSPGPDSPAVVRLSVATPRGRVDVALPAGIPIAEVTAELASRLDLAGAVILSTVLGERLDPSRTVSEQVSDGSVLQLLLAEDGAEPIVFDDPSEAVSRAVGEPGGAVGVVRRAAVMGGCAAALIGGLAGFALLPAIALSLLATAGVSVVLMVACVATSRARPEWAGLFAWAAVGYAACSAAEAGDRALTVWVPGAALTVAGCLWVGMERGRAAVVPLVVVALAVLMGVALTRVPGWAASAETMVVLGLVVVAAVLMGLPRICVTVAGQEVSNQAQVAAWVRRGHQALLAGVVSLGIVLTMLAPLATVSGPAPACLAVDVCVAMLLCSRWMPSAPSVCAALASGLLAVSAGVVTALICQPTWRVPLIVALLITASGTAVLALTSGRAGTHRALLAERAEWLSRFCLVPLAVWALDLPAWAARTAPW